MSVIEAVETALSNVEKEVVAEVKKVDQRTRVEISDAEKFFMSRTENDFLKAQVEIQQLSQRITHLQGVATKAQNSFVAKTEELAKKYEISLKEFVYNAVDSAFDRSPVPQEVKKA